MASLSAFTASAASAQQTYKLGDVDLSGTIDLDDLTCMKKGIFWLSQLSDVQKRTADIDQNGHVDLKDLADLALRMVPFGVPEYIEAKRLLSFLEWVKPLDRKLVPANSILSEFIGGSNLKDFISWSA